MRFPARIAKLIAKIALGMVIGEKRTDEAAEVFGDACQEINAWLRQQDDSDRSTTVSRELLVHEIVTSEATQATADQRADLDFFLSELDALPEKSVGDVQGLLTQVLPRRRASYLLWLSVPELTPAGEGRYVHFSWEITNAGDSYRVRDYLSGMMYHPREKKPTDVEWQKRPLDLRAVDIWRQAADRIPCTKRTGLYISVREMDWWRQKLGEMTEQRKKENY